MELGPASETNNGYDIFRGIESFVISDFLSDYTSHYPKEASYTTTLGLLNDAVSRSQKYHGMFLFPKTGEVG